MHEGKFYVQRGARVVEPAPTEIVRATAINFGDWEGTPEYHRFQERVATVFPAEDDRQIATDDIINNVRYPERMTAQQMKNLGYGWAHYVDHGFGGQGPQSSRTSTIWTRPSPRTSNHQ